MRKEVSFLQQPFGMLLKTRPVFFYNGRVLSQNSFLQQPFVTLLKTSPIFSHDERVFYRRYPAHDCCGMYSYAEKYLIVVLQTNHTIFQSG